MVNVIAAAGLAIGGYLLVRAVKREMSRVERRVSEAAKRATGELPVTKLEQDPETGRYRPKD